LPTSFANPIALIFDMDGVLVHSMPLHTLAWERYLAKLGIRVENLEQRMHGKRNSELVRDMIGADLPADIVFKHGAEKERLFREVLSNEESSQFAVPGLHEFLSRHRDAPKAVASNAEPQNIDFVLDHYDLRPFFPVTVNGMQVKRPKPVPGCFPRGGAASQHCAPRLYCV
jgi:beta-phosphoglucomutase-like phosphatase (HAD superfamily)